ncbi:hypothetical protein D3C85_1024750 [compost metagenome]
MAEDIQKALQRLVPFLALGDVIEIRGRQRRIDAIHPQKGGTDDWRFAVIVFVVFDGFQFADRKTHPRMRRKPHRIVSRMAG